MPHPTISFRHAITRRPARSATSGLRAEDRGAPDIARMRRDHAAYVQALEGTGARVTVLEPLEAFPDAHFVEDVALCLPEGAVVLTPGAPSRRGESDLMAKALERYYGAVTPLPGAGELARLTAPWGHELRICETPKGVLHFKTGCALLDEETILATPRLAASGCFAGYRTLLTPEGEEAAANAIRFNDQVFLPAGFPRTAEMLAQAGFSVTPLRNDEFALLDGGMSCLSLRF